MQFVVGIELLQRYISIDLEADMIAPVAAAPRAQAFRATAAV
jgi:hypothetical protein